VHTDTFAVPPCFAVLSREQPFRVQIHPCSVTGVPGGSYFCFQKHRFAATAHKAVSVCLRLWLAPSANSLLPGDQPTSLAQRLFGISLRKVYYAVRFVKQECGRAGLSNLSTNASDVAPTRQRHFHEKSGSWRRELEALDITNGFLTSPKSSYIIMQHSLLLSRNLLYTGRAQLFSNS